MLESILRQVETEGRLTLGHSVVDWSGARPANCKVATVCVCVCVCVCVGARARASACVRACAYPRARAWSGSGPPADNPPTAISESFIRVTCPSNLLARGAGEGGAERFDAHGQPDGGHTHARARAHEQSTRGLVVVEADTVTNHLYE